MNKFKIGDIVTVDREIQIGSDACPKFRVLKPGEGYTILAIYKNIIGVTLCLLDLCDFAQPIYASDLKLVSRATATEDVTRICWNDMTEKEKSDFLFLLSHQKSAAEPVSEELEQEISRFCNQILNGENESYTKSFVSSQIDYIARHFVNWQKQRIMTLLSAEKENTGIGLCEYDAGNENGRMDVINSLTDKIKAL